MSRKSDARNVAVLPQTHRTIMPRPFRTPSAKHLMSCGMAAIPILCCEQNRNIIFRTSRCRVILGDNLESATMGQTTKPTVPEAAPRDAIKEQVDEAIEICGGDACKAVRGLILGQPSRRLET